MAILGVGLIGGSLGLALRASGRRRVVGWDPDGAVLDQAIRLGAIDASAATIEAACADASVVVIAAPVPAIPALLVRVAPAIAAGTVVTDTGSTKASIVEAGERVIGARFVGGHPMAGTEESGIVAASKALFSGAVWVVTPGAGTDPAAEHAVADLIREVGARAVRCAPRAHDEWVATVSHLPHLVAYALAAAAGPLADTEGADLAAGSFRDGTRVALSDATLWTGILMDNRDAALGALDRFTQQVAEVRDALARGDRAALARFLDMARRARRRFPV